MKDCQSRDKLYANKIYKTTYPDPWEIYLNLHIALHGKQFFVVMSKGLDFSWLSSDRTLLGSFLA